MSPKVTVVVSITLPSNKPCTSLSNSDRNGIERQFCTDAVSAAGMNAKSVDCVAILSCSSKKRSLLQSTTASLKANFKIITTSESDISSSNAAAASLASVAKEDSDKIVKDMIPGATASVNTVNTTKGSKPPSGGSTSGSNAGSTASSVCSLTGTYAIRPLYSPCSIKYLSYSYKPRCKKTSTSVVLRPAKAVGSSSSLNWEIRASGTKGSVAIVGSKLKKCKTRNLSASTGTLRLGGSAWTWKVVPAKAGDCSTVMLFSGKRKGYLTLDAACKTFSYGVKNTKGSLWRVVKRK